MIEWKDILALCDQYERYLPWLDIHVLRRRYNGEIYQSTQTVAAEMGLSDETVRSIENRALDALAYCVELDQAGQEIIPMRLAKSFKQPVASLICQDLWRSASCATYTAHRGELLLFSPRRPMEPNPCEPHVRDRAWDILHMTAQPRGAIIGRILLTNGFMIPMPVRHTHPWILKCEQPELFPEPIPYSGQPSYVSSAMTQPSGCRRGLGLHGRDR